MVDSDERIFNFSKPPILLIGAGIPRRYVKNFPLWEELLESVADRIGINKGRLVAFKHDAEEKGIMGTMPKVSTDLKKYLIDGIKEGTIDPSKIFNQDEYINYLKGIDPIKIMVTSKLKNIELTDDLNLMEEIEIFKKLTGIVPCVITTNYDEFLEKNIFNNEFETYSRVSDYYLSGSQGIGEIYKIHGTSAEPNTLILNEEDYLNFDDNSKIVSAKLLSTLCDYPMVVLGYSLEDLNVKKIINDLISSLESDKLREIEQNIIYVAYSPHDTEIIRETINFEFKGERLSISSIKTNNFKAIFKELSEMVPSASPANIRKIRKLVKKIVVVGDSKGDKYMTIGIDDLSSETSNKLVLVITDESNAKRIQKIPTYTTQTMINDILNDDSEFDTKAIIDHFLTSGIFRLNEYVPIFHFIRMNMKNVEKSDNFLEKFIKEKKKQFSIKLNAVPQNLKDRLNSVTSVNDFENVMKDFLLTQTPMGVMYCFDNNLISEKESLEILKEYCDKNKASCETYFRCALSYLAFKDLGYAD